MTQLPTDILMQLIRARRACLVQLRDLGRHQVTLIGRGNVSGLLDVLTVKQKPLNDLQRIERALDPFRSQDPEQRQWHSAADRAACSQLVSECEAILKETVALEKHCENAMIEQRDTTAARLQQLRSAGQAHGAYFAVSHTEISQLDLTSGT